MNDAKRRVEQARVARLATVGADGRPHVVPIVFALVAGVVYTAVDDKPKRTRALKRLANVRANPAVSVLVDEYDDDWSRLWWVRLDGRGRILEEGEEFERALDALAGKYAQYRGARPGGPVIAVDVSGWRSWAAS